MPGLKPSAQNRLSLAVSVALTLGCFFVRVGFSSEAIKQTETVIAPTEFQRIYFSYFGMYQGPGVANPGGRGAIDSSSLTYENGEQNLQSQFKLDYFLTPQIFVGAVLNFQLNPLGGVPAQMLDSGFRIGHQRLVHTDNFNLMADVRLTGPMKPDNIRNNELVDFQSLQVLTYNIPKTNFTLGMVGFHTLQIYGSSLRVLSSNDPGAAKDWNLFFGPYASYHLSQSLSALVSYDLHPYHRVGANWDTWAADPTDIAPGISWDITGDINFQTQILMYPSKFGWNTMGTMAYLYWQII